MPFRFSIKYLSNVLGFFDFVKDQVPQSLWMQLLIIIIISQDNLVKIIESGPCFFSDKHSFYLKLIYMRTICKHIYVLSSIQEICMQMIPLKGYRHCDLRLPHCKNTLPVSREHSKYLVAYLPYYKQNN